MRLTKLEMEILRHRLEVPDAICDALCDVEPSYPYEGSLGDEIDSITRRVTAGHWGGLSECEKDILEDCIDGSTFLAVHLDMANDGVISRQKFQSVERAINSLGEKASSLIGRRIRVPAG